MNLLCNFIHNVDPTDLLHFTKFQFELNCKLNEDVCIDCSTIKTINIALVAKLEVSFIVEEHLATGHNFKMAAAYN